MVQNLTWVWITIEQQLISEARCCCVPVAPWWTGSPQTPPASGSPAGPHLSPHTAPMTTASSCSNKERFSYSHLSASISLCFWLSREKKAVVITIRPTSYVKQLSSKRCRRMFRMWATNLPAFLNERSEWWVFNKDRGAWRETSWPLMSSCGQALMWAVGESIVPRRVGVFFFQFKTSQLPNSQKGLKVGFYFFYIRNENSFVVIRFPFWLQWNPSPLTTSVVV